MYFAADDGAGCKAAKGGSGIGEGSTGAAGPCAQPSTRHQQAHPLCSSQEELSGGEQYYTMVCVEGAGESACSVWPVWPEAGQLQQHKTLLRRVVCSLLSEADRANPMLAVSMNRPVIFSSHQGLRPFEASSTCGPGPGHPCHTHDALANQRVTHRVCTPALSACTAGPAPVQLGLQVREGLGGHEAQQVCSEVRGGRIHSGGGRHKTAPQGGECIRCQPAC